MLNRPVAAIRTGFDRVGALLAVYDENARLREENRRLLGWQAEAAKLSVQNQALRRMLNVPPVADAAGLDHGADRRRFRRRVRAHAAASTPVPTRASRWACRR